MSRERIKLVTWPKIILMILACFVGASYRLVKEYYESGNIAPSEIMISAITFFIGLVIVFLVAHYANKPEE